MEKKGNLKRPIIEMSKQIFLDGITPPFRAVIREVGEQLGNGRPASYDIRTDTSSPQEDSDGQIIEFTLYTKTVLITVSFFK